MLRFIGKPKSALLVGEVNAPLAEELRSAGCDVAAIVFDEDAAKSAQPYCSTVDIAEPQSWTLPNRVAAMGFDRIVFEGALELVQGDAEMLRNTATLLSDGGYIAGVLPHTAHGAIRLALIHGMPGDGYLGVTSAREAIDLFERADLQVETVHRVTSPLFGDESPVPNLKRADFPTATIAEIEADPESETASFVVIAVPKDRDSKLGADPPEHWNDRFVVPFETAFEAQRRQTHLELELKAALEELDRERGRVIALDIELRNEIERLRLQLNKKDVALRRALKKLPASREERVPK